MMKEIFAVVFLAGFFAVSPCFSQQPAGNESLDEDWDRTREMLECIPRLVDRQEMVEDNFEHRYVTNNPRDIEVGYFSVEPITFFEEGRRFCEASLPAAGVSQSYFRGTYKTGYVLPGNGVYRISLESNALIFNNEIRVINAQNTVATIEASHRLQISVDSTMTSETLVDLNSSTVRVYKWEIELDESGEWQGNFCEGECNMQEEEIPGGLSTNTLVREIKGPGVITISESVIFHVDALSSFKYDPIFQAVCLFNLEPLSVSAKLLPCK